MLRVGDSGGEDARLSRALDAVRRLRQREEVWECSGRVARWWVVGSDKRPYRPNLIVAVTADSREILHNGVSEAQPTSGQMLAALLGAMHRPLLGSGRARRPSLVCVDDQGHVAELAPALAGIGVRCEYRHTLPALGEALRQIEARMDRRPPLPGLLTVPGVTVPLVGHLCELAADYFREAPWDHLTDREPFEIRFPPDSSPRYAVVMGSGREIFGLSVYDSIEHLGMALAGLESPELCKAFTWLAFILGEPVLLSYEDLDDMARYGWDLAGEHAYPLFARTTHEGEFTAPAAADVFWLEGALSGLLAYVRHRMRFQGGRIRPAALTLPVVTIGGDRSLYLRVPVVVPPPGRPVVTASRGGR